MKLYYIVAVLIWIRTVTATLESDSRGNWSNEKKLNYEQERIGNRTKEEITGDVHSPHERIFILSSESTESIKAERPEELDVKFANKNEDNREVNKQLTKQLVQPYMLPLPLETRYFQQDTHNESRKNVSRLARTSENSPNETATVEYIPSKEILVQDSTTTSNNYPIQDSFNDLAYSNSEDQADLEYVGEFGQRVRSSPSFRSKSNENVGRDRFRPLDTLSLSEDYRKQHRKNSRPFVIKKLNASDSIANLFSKDRHPVASGKASESQRGPKPKKTGGEEEYSDTIDYNKENVVSSSSKDTVSSTSAPLQQVSFGKFTGPIVVADLPQQKRYSFATTTGYTIINDEPQSTPASLETIKSKAAESSYLATSSAVLNPLQVGVAMMNVVQEINSVNDPVTFTKEYPRNEPDPSQVPVVTTDIESIIQNDAATDSGNSTLQTDQLSQQEEISEMVASNGPTQSVEIQKSVEVFHTAPVHEIHYPLEFVPYVQQSSNFKQRQQTDYRKPPQGGQEKDQRASQINVYKNNEILDETVSSNNPERNRYEYTVNEDDVVQVDQTVAHSTDVKPVFDAREQLEDVQDNQTAGRYSKIQRIPDTIATEGIAKNEYDPVGIIDNLPALGNVENSQASEEVPEILLIKPTNEPSTEVRFLMAVPQHYPGEKVHVYRTVNVDEKKVPYQIEKVIEKQITIPQPFPVQVPVDRVVEKQIRIPYPVHVEKVIEKKVPLAVQRFIIPLPIHLRIPQPVPIPVEKVVEKSVPVPVPIPVEKVIEKTVVHHPRPHPLDMEKIRPYPLETPKLVKTAPAPPLIYNDGNFQQIRQQNFQAPLGPSYEKNHYNSTQFYGSGYLAVNRPFVRQSSSVHALPKKFGSYGTQYPHSLVYSSLNGPVPRKVQLSLGIQSKSIQYAPPDVQSTMRRTRQEGNTGSFRQSKMEYGFKPPMVPSIQYDEQTATKVE
ncbi:uncharacterized protein LOC114880062 isoform X2 [Osmia bicornis bicornis]|uniref:uncharacterized protein LOC114880062 isoform X2 n=1 Tax=Osmia bicornis bicornis TaxID=1437191 RepID=UPI0010F96ADC|nr:uncharacterized protein LOC114880062 isoform X2 [Osmia bicornis bicornis]